VREKSLKETSLKSGKTHEQYMRDQDGKLDEISRVMGQLKVLGEGMGDTLDEQNRMLEELDNDVEHTDYRLKRAMNEMRKI